MRISRIFAYLGSLFLLASLLSACGSLPQPFRHAEGEMVLLPELAGGAVVYPIDGDRGDGYSLAEAMVYVLNVAEIPALMRSPVGGTEPPLFAGKTVVIEGRIVDDRTIVWSVSSASGEILGEYTQKLEKKALEGTSAEARRGIAQRALPGIINLLPIDKTRNVAGPAHIKLIPVADAPGDGDTRLTSAMRVALKEAGFILTDADPSYVLSGVVLVTPYQSDSDMVAVTWLMTYPDGSEFARIQQANPVPKGTMERPWGNLATLIAEGGVMGVQKALSKKIEKEGGVR